MSTFDELAAKATARPWRVDPGPEVDPTDYVIFGGPPPPNEQWVANLNPDPNRLISATGVVLNTAYVGMPDARLAELMKWDNAALIVLAVNNIEPLVAAMRAVIAAMDARPGIKGFCQWTDAEHQAVGQARAALAALEGAK